MKRFDLNGLFWDDTAQEKAKNVRLMPDIPDTGWQPPAYFPDLSNEKAIAIDVETYDPDLTTKGPGWARGVGHICGISVAVESGHSWYFPMRHEVEPKHNIDPAAVLAWARDYLTNPRQAKVGANLMYDIGWLRHSGVDVKGFPYDVQYAAALLTEREEVNLEALGQRYLGQGKESNLLYQWCAAFYGGKPNGKQRANIYRAPPRLVGPYAESDTVLPLKLMPLLYNKLREQELWDLFLLECRGINLLIDMRFAGVRVDLAKAQQLSDALEQRIAEEQTKLDSVAGVKVNEASRATIVEAFINNGLKYPFTEKGEPSFTKEFLNSVDHPLVRHLLEVRRLNKLKGTFIDSYILDAHINGFLYPSFHPMRGDENGTRSGRYASSDPNLQNVPSRDEELAPLVRGLFVPDHGHRAWRKYDYSQIEYRFLVEFAVGPGADQVREIFCKNPKVDYHELTQQLVKEKTGIVIDRKPTKNINFGLIYGMGIPKLIRSLGLSSQEGRELFRAYHSGAPYVKPTMDDCSNFAKRYGYITTILGRRSRFDLWGPTQFNEDKPPLTLDRALQEYGEDIERAYSHKALNRRLQGSAADLIKKAMVECYEQGIFDYTGVPRLQVHDELNFSDPGDVDDAFKEMQRVMETAIQLRVPIKVDGEIGPNWGNVKEL